jgi:ABC-type branched-subunit amino acid transport system substrate-binding protein
VRRLVLLALTALVSACGGSSGEGEREQLTIVVNAPFSEAPYVGDAIANGARLGAATVNQRGGISAGGKSYELRVVTRDTARSPRRAVQNVRRAADDGAVAVIDEGTGVDASWRAAADAGLPLAIAYQGGLDLVDEEERPNVFRIAPTDRGISFRLAEYLIPKGLKIALLTDDTGYGVGGREALDRAFGSNPEAVAARIELPAGALDVAPQVLRARRAGATALLVWAQPSAVAAVLTAARSAGWDVPVYTSQTGADPLVRQQLADRPEWVDGLTFASGRMTAEVGSAPFETFRRAYEDSFGVDRVGVRTRAGREVVQPPEIAMYSYDFVNVLAAAIATAGSVEGEDVLAALEEVTVPGANGDERGFTRTSHEGVVDDDVYFARFEDMTFRPVADDPLSSTLPVIPQVR